MARLYIVTTLVLMLWALLGGPPEWCLWLLIALNCVGAVYYATTGFKTYRAIRRQIDEAAANRPVMADTIEVHGQKWRIHREAEKVWAELEQGTITEAEAVEIRNELRVTLGYPPLPLPVPPMPLPPEPPAHMQQAHDMWQRIKDGEVKGYSARPFDGTKRPPRGGSGLPRPDWLK